MPTVSQPGYFSPQFFTAQGDLAESYRLYTYTAGTTTHKVAYTDSAGSVAHTYTPDGLGGQYIATNARGELPSPLYLSNGAYDIALKTTVGVTVWTRRTEGTSDASSAADTALRADLAANDDAAKGAALIGFDATLAYPVGSTGYAMKVRSINLADYPYNALGQGADETAVIQAALDAALAAGGGTVFGRPGADYHITAALRIGTGVRLDLQKAIITQDTNNTPVIEIFGSGSQQWSGVSNGTLYWPTRQGPSNPNSIGVRVSSGGLTNYQLRFQDLLVGNAYRSFDVPNTSSTFAFLMSFDGCTSVDASDYGWYIQGDTAIGGCTNVRLDGCWVVQTNGSEIATSKGYAFIGVSQLEVSNIACDHIQGLALYLQLCSGRIGSISIESCDFSESSGLSSMALIEGGDVEIGVLQSASNTVAISGSGDFAFLRVATNAKFRIGSMRDLSCAVTDTSSGAYHTVYVSGASGSDGYVRHYTAQGVTPAVLITEPSVVSQLKVFNGTDRTVIIGTDPSYNPANMADLTGITRPFTVPGVVLGDRVVWKAWSADLAGITLDAWVSGTDQVKYRFFNSTGVDVDLAPGNFTCGVQKAA